MNEHLHELIRGTAGRGMRSPREIVSMIRKNTLEYELLEDDIRTCNAIEQRLADSFRDSLCHAVADREFLVMMLDNIAEPIIENAATKALHQWSLRMVNRKRKRSQTP